uniref:Germin-like protein n=1 Tax=Ananas comosus var. bracteatus TaxID=296719 RepID=A0A6V7Q700_ANACO|nr:unnamed protein product [Ananas comosus var. bracteatus]
MASRVLLFALLALVLSQAIASDPSPLQDFCVADMNSPVFVNGLVCKNPNFTTPEDFFFKGLDQPDNKLFSKVLNKGDVFVFPEGLIHFQFNVGKTSGFGISGLSSQNPGLITIANAVFKSNPPISDDILAKAFQLDKKIVDWIQTQL